MDFRNEQRGGGGGSHDQPLVTSSATAACKLSIVTGRVHLLIFRWHLSALLRKMVRERPHDRSLCDPQIIYLIPFFVIISPSVEPD